MSTARALPEFTLPLPGRRFATTLVAALAMALLGDFSNELVPRWIEIVVVTESSGPAGERTHRVVLQDRQPKWRNDDLLSRLSQV